MGVKLGWRVEDAETPSLDLGRPSRAGQEGGWYRSQGRGPLQVTCAGRGQHAQEVWVPTFVGLLEPWV